VGPGDVLEITSWKGTEQRIYPVTIGGDGKISFSFVQNISVNGMTLDEVSTLLRREMGKYLREPALDVRVKEYHSKTVTILGAIGSNPYRVSGPGVYPLKGKTTLLMAISDAGGPAANANLQQVSIRKKGGATVTVNLYRTIARGDLTQNVVLDAGDTVLVPELGMAENKVYVLGEVKNPGAFSVKGEITLVEAIALAGSATEPAVLEDTKILRGDLTRPQVLSSDVRRLMKKGDMSQNVKVLPGDIIFVPRSRLGDVTAFLREILPILQTIALPVQFYDYTR